MKALKNFFQKYPWVWLLFLFGLLLIGWVVLIVIARSNPPQFVPLD